MSSASTWKNSWTKPRIRKRSLNLYVGLFKQKESKPSPQKTAVTLFRIEYVPDCNQTDKTMLPCVMGTQLLHTDFTRQAELYWKEHLDSVCVVWVCFKCINFHLIFSFLFWTAVLFLVLLLSHNVREQASTPVSRGRVCIISLVRLVMILNSRRIWF